MMRRSALDAVGPLDPSFYFFGEETDWCRRAQNAGYELHYAPVGEITHFGGGSSGPLSFRRDLMLTSATVRLHRKHESLFAAWLVYAHLLVFNLSRSVFWACLNAFGPTPGRARRSDHFAKVVAHYREAWPVHQGAKS